MGIEDFSYKHLYEVFQWLALLIVRDDGRLQLSVQESGITGYDTKTSVQETGKNESREDVGRTDSKVRPYSGAKDRFVGGDKCKSNLPLDDENLKEEENTSSINTDDCDPGRNLTLPDPEKNKESHSGTFPMGLTDSDLNHQPPDGMDKGNRAKGTKKLKRRKRKTKSGQTKMSKVHYTDHAMDILLRMSRMILKFVETRYGGQIIAGLIWFLLINNTTANPMPQSVAIHGWNTDVTEAPFQCVSCRLHLLCTDGKKLLNQDLTINSNKEFRWCSLHPDGLAHIEPCKGSVVRVLNETCLMVEEKGKTNPDYFLEYSDGTARGKTSRSVPAGCCDIDPTVTTTPALQIDSALDNINITADTNSTNDPSSSSNVPLIASIVAGIVLVIFGVLYKCVKRQSVPQMVMRPRMLYNGDTVTGETPHSNGSVQADQNSPNTNQISESVVREEHEHLIAGNGTSVQANQMNGSVLDGEHEHLIGGNGTSVQANQMNGSVLDNEHRFN